MSNLAMVQNRNYSIGMAVKEYGNRLFRFIRGKVSNDEDAEDILQDVWYQYANASATQTIEQVSGWLFAVARNKITDRYRKKKVDYIEDEGFENEEGEFLLKEVLFTEPADHEMAEIQKMFWEELFKGLDELPEAQRLAFALNELEDMTLQEIADMYGENIKTIISRKRYAVIHLRKKLQHLYDALLNN